MIFGFGLKRDENFLRWLFLEPRPVAQDQAGLQDRDLVCRHRSRRKPQQQAIP